MQSLLQLIAGKSADPAAIEAALKAMVQEELQTALAALQSGEQKALDALKADVSAWIAALLAAGETHQMRNEVSFVEGKTVVITRWEKK